MSEGQTVNGELYLQVLRRLKRAVGRKRRELWPNAWILHHDNAPAHSCRIVQDFLDKHEISTLTHPPYSPDLAPNDFWLFPSLNAFLKGTRFQTVDNIQRNVTKELMVLSKSDFRKCFQKWQDRENKCIQSRSDYFEGDNNS